MTETTTTFDDLVSAFDDWFDHDKDDARDIAERFNTDIGGMLGGLGITEFWSDLSTLFDQAYDDEGSPLTMPRGAGVATLVRQEDGDGGVSCCLVVFYVGSLKLATRAFEQRELCTDHETGRLAAAEALATLTAEIHKVAAPFATVDVKERGDNDLGNLLRRMRAAITLYHDSKEEPDLRKACAADAIDAAAQIDRALTNGRRRPDAWIDQNAEDVRVAVLAMARAEAEMAHRWHSEASDECDKLRAENRDLKRQIAELRAELDKTREGWTVIGVWDNDRAMPAGVVRGRFTDVTGGNPDGHWSQGVWATPVDADTAEEAERLAVAAMEFEECFTPGCEENAAESLDDDRCDDCARLISTLESRGGEDINWHDKRTRAEMEAAVAKTREGQAVIGVREDEPCVLIWESAGTEEPGDQVADSHRRVPEGCTSAAYEIGPDSEGYWSVEMIGRRNGEEHIVVHLGTADNRGAFASEEDAKAAAALYELGDDDVTDTTTND